MNDRRPQDLSEAFNSIISMMLAVIRAHGWRCLLHLPELWRQEREFRRMGEEFAALVAAFRAGTLPPLPEPAPEPEPEPLAAWPEQEAEYAYPQAAPRPAARPDPAAPRVRRAPAVRRPPLAAATEPGRRRGAYRAYHAALLRLARPHPGMRPLPSRRAPGPTAWPGLPTVATGRST